MPRSHVILTRHTQRNAPSNNYSYAISIHPTPCNNAQINSCCSGIGLFTYHKYRKSIDSPVPLDAHGNPITIVDEGSLALGSSLGDGPTGVYDDSIGLGTGVGGDEESVPLARAMDPEAVSGFLPRFVQEFGNVRSHLAAPSLIVPYCRLLPVVHPALSLGTVLLCYDDMFLLMDADDPYLFTLHDSSIFGTIRLIVRILTPVRVASGQIGTGLLLPQSQEILDTNLRDCYSQWTMLKARSTKSGKSGSCASWIVSSVSIRTIRARARQA